MPLTEQDIRQRRVVSAVQHIPRLPPTSKPASFLRAIKEI